jgi:secondary thiamine-phosphate synthase enzyme
MKRQAASAGEAGPGEATAAALSVSTDAITVPSRGDSHMIDLTASVQALVERNGYSEGHALVFVVGSTAALTTVEFEPGLQRDLPAALERIAPRGLGYAHEQTWHDDNGHSHVRASLLGPSLAVPFRRGRLLLGTWQQVVLLDFDTRPRQRQVIVQLSGRREAGSGTTDGRSANQP